jgi:mycothiol synthase
VLERALRESAGLPPEPPAGVRVRACADEADRKQAHAFYQATFAEHFDFEPREYERWLDDIHADRLDWFLVWLVFTEGLGDVGFVIARDDREAVGWIRSLGVVRETRGRGLGGLLLRQAFAAFAARGGTP